MFLGAILHSGVEELLFWGSFAKKYKPFGESRIQFGESETFWQNPRTIIMYPIGWTNLKAHSLKSDRQILLLCHGGHIFHLIRI